MILVFHILAALSSLVYTTYMYVRPSHRSFYVVYGLVAATLSSGAYLVISTHAPIVSSCTTGLIYLGIIATGLVAAHRKTI